MRERPLLGWQPDKFQEKIIFAFRRDGQPYTAFEQLKPIVVKIAYSPMVISAMGRGRAIYIASHQVELAF